MDEVTKDTEDMWKFLETFTHPDINGLDEDWFGCSQGGEIFGPWNYRHYVIDKIRK